MWDSAASMTTSSSPWLCTTCRWSLRGRSRARTSGEWTATSSSLRIFGVSQEFIRELRSAGLTPTDADKLVAFLIHGVSPEAVREFRRAGIYADEDELIAFQIHGVSAEFVAELDRLGYANIEPDQL